MRPRDGLSMAQPEPLGIGFEVVGVDQDAPPLPALCRYLPAPHQPADLLGAVRDDPLLGDLVRRP